MFLSFFSKKCFFQKDTKSSVSYTCFAKTIPNKSTCVHILLLQENSPLKSKKVSTHIKRDAALFFGTILYFEINEIHSITVQYSNSFIFLKIFTVIAFSKFDLSNSFRPAFPVAFKYL